MFSEELLVSWLLEQQRYVALSDIAAVFQISFNQIYEVLYGVHLQGGRYHICTYRVKCSWCKAVLLCEPPVPGRNKNHALRRAALLNDPGNMHHYWLELLRQGRPFRKGDVSGIGKCRGAMDIDELLGV
ncbi:TPA: hypothetical protein RUX41_004259 [Aeromonas dhakensis]|nr:hypothetical protein [Aeromonas dhakensis]